MGEEAAAPSLDNTGLAFGLVVAAGLSTALGAAAVFYKRIVKLASKEVLAAGLGFSGGVMIYVSFVEIFVKSQEAFGAEKEERDAYFCATLCFFAGMVFLRLISVLVHMLDKNHQCACDTEVLEEAIEKAKSEDEQAMQQQANPGEGNPEAGETSAAAATAATAEADGSKATSKEGADASSKKPSGQSDAARKAAKLQQMGLNTAAAIAIHNFPEGLATFVATLAEPSVGITLAVAIGIHNIPEGLCVALPIYYATDSRWKGFLWALLSGISEPVGAFIGWCIVKGTGEDMNQTVYGVLFGMVGGMMVMIVILELLPTAFQFDPKDKYVSNSVVLGMAVMSASLCLFMA